MTLQELEQRALANNPTLQQAEAAVQAALGRKVQAGLYPNPVLGYSAEELVFRALGDTNEHFLFLEQTIVTAGKLRKSRNIFAREQDQAEVEAETQRLRVLNSVRLLYYESLGAQRLVELRRDLLRIATEAVSISQQLFNVGQADQPDLLEAEIEARQAEIDLISAENHLEQTWEVLAAVVGDPTLRPGPLSGNLEDVLPQIDRDEIFKMLLRSSPEIKRAESGVTRAEAALERARAEPIPDIRVRGGIGYSFDRLDTLPGRRAGPEAFLEIGVELPLFDRNQGNVAAAHAEVRLAQQEVRRLEFVLRARLATTYKQYANALGIVQRYRDGVLPHAERAYQLYLERFREMGAAYPHVLIAQRTLFQTRSAYVAALVDAWQSVVQLKGLLLAGGLMPPAETGVDLPSREPGVEGWVTPGIQSGAEGTGIETESPDQ